MVHKIKNLKKGILYWQTGEDYTDYAENVANTPKDISSHKKLAKDMFKKAKKLGITRKNVDKYYDKLLTEEEKNDLSNLHPIEIEKWARSL
jgi:uncharacterized protein YabN with tetrapyrrole methylase and pyrophosphatase domain